MIFTRLQPASCHGKGERFTDMERCRSCGELRYCAASGKLIPPPWLCITEVKYPQTFKFVTVNAYRLDGRKGYVVYLEDMIIAFEDPSDIIYEPSKLKPPNRSSSASLCH